MEAAGSLRARGISIDVIAPETHPLEKVFARELSDLVLEAHIRKGVRLHLGSKVAAVKSNRVLLEGGQMPAADKTYYVAQVVAARTGLSQADAEKRVSDGVDRQE
jgi:NADPH-dependent 2,4-dienoyl-CoA reductase/sulfur reductase-like enzyme